MKKRIYLCLIILSLLLCSCVTTKQNDNSLLYSEKEITKLEEYITKSYGPFDIVIHEIVSPDIHLDIAVVNPTEKDPYYKLITMGAGAYDMNVPKELKKYKLERAEYVIYLPADWNLNSKEDEDFWPIGNLKMIGRLALYTDSWLAFGHTISANEDYSPVAKNTGFTSFILLNSIGIDDEVVEPLSLGKTEINFYQIYPLYQEELEYEMETSFDDLFDKIGSGESDCIVNINRKNYCK